MRRGGFGKRKGSAFERQVCKDLSLWLTGGKSTDVLWRSAMSGGRATVGLKRGEVIRQAGDICAVAPEGHDFCERFFIECKHIKDLRLQTFVISNKGPLADFWAKVCEQAKHHRREPVLIAKSNLVPTLLITKSGSPLQTTPVAHLLGFRDCAIGLFETMLQECVWP